MKNQIFKNNISYLIDKFAAGNTSKFAEFLGVKRVTVRAWEKTGAVPEGENCKILAEKTGYDIATLLEKDISKPDLMIREEQAEYIATLHSDEKINNLLDITARVLTSGTRHAKALEENILSFEEAVEDKKKASEHPPSVPTSRAGGGK